jgi:PAS domain-containing protein
MNAPDQQLRAIIDTIPPLVWSARPDGSAEFFNRRWLDYTGLSYLEAIKDRILPRSCYETRTQPKSDILAPA